MKKIGSYPSEHTDQRGAALAMALVFLLLLTIIGVTALSTTSLQEKMAGNLKDKQMAFQAAETALLAGESWALAQISKPVVVVSNTADGLHLPSTGALAVWDSLDWKNSTDVVTYPGSPGVPPATNPFTYIKTEPKWILEELPEMKDTSYKGGSLVMPSNYKSTSSSVYRITGYGTGQTDFAEAMVQSVIIREF